MLRGPGGNTSSGLSEVLLDKWCGGPRVPPELLFQLLSSPLTHTESSWRQSYMAAGTSQASSGQNESVTCWQCARFSESAGIIWMSSCADVWAIDRVVMWEMKEKVLSRLHFNEKPLMSFCFSSPRCCAPAEWAREGSQTLFGSLHECNLERYSISQRLRKKNVWWDCVWTVQRGKWLAGAWGKEELLEWNTHKRVCSPDTSDIGRMWQMQMLPSAVSVHAAMAVTWSRKINDINRVADVDLVLWTLSTSDSHFPSLQGHGFMRDSQSVLRLWLTISGSDWIWLSGEFFWVRYRIPPVGPPQDPKPLVLSVCLSWWEEHKALHWGIPR